jgi:hypothetical protein
VGELVEHREEARPDVVVGVDHHRRHARVRYGEPAHLVDVEGAVLQDEDAEILQRLPPQPEHPEALPVLPSGLLLRVDRDPCDLSDPVAPLLWVERVVGENRLKAPPRRLLLECLEQRVDLLLERWHLARERTHRAWPRKSWRVTQTAKLHLEGLLARWLREEQDGERPLVHDRGLPRLDQRERLLPRLRPLEAPGRHTDPLGSGFGGHPGGLAGPSAPPRDAIQPERHFTRARDSYIVGTNLPDTAALRTRVSRGSPGEFPICGRRYELDVTVATSRGEARSAGELAPSWWGGCAIRRWL